MFAVSWQRRCHPDGLCRALVAETVDQAQGRRHAAHRWTRDCSVQGSHARAHRAAAQAAGGGAGRSYGEDVPARGARSSFLPQGRPRGGPCAPERCAIGSDMSSQKCSFCIGFGNNYANNYAFPLEIVTFAPASPEAGGSACGALYRIPNKRVSRSCWRSCW